MELEPEVRDWLLGRSSGELAQVIVHIDRLAAQGPLLSEPYSRQLRGKLRELRLYVGRRQVRITYYIASGRRIVLLTVFAKTSMRERAEIARAEQALLRCIAEGHSAEDDDDGE